MVTRQDQVAFTWINENIPDESVFSINNFQWDGQIKPIDGGAWLTSFTGNNLQYPNFLVDKDEFWNFVIENNIEYFYFGNRLGQIEEDWLTGCPVVYQKNDIQVILLISDLCLANQN